MSASHLHCSNLGNEFFLFLSGQAETAISMNYEDLNGIVRKLSTMGSMVWCPDCANMADLTLHMLTILFHYRAKYAEKRVSRARATDDKVGMAHVLARIEMPQSNSVFCGLHVHSQAKWVRKSKATVDVE